MTAIIAEEPGAEDVHETDEAQDHTIQLVFDAGYGWVCVAACFVVNICTWGIVSVSHLSEYSACH